MEEAKIKQSMQKLNRLGKKDGKKASRNWPFVEL